METKERSYKSHVIVLPYPAQGHINPILQFSKRLVSKGVKVTLANTIAINKTMHSVPNSPIDIQTYSDGFDEGGFAQAESTELYLSKLQEMGSKTFADLIKKLQNSDFPVSAVIYDGFLTWGLDVAKQFGLMGVVFFTQSCAVNNIYYHVQRELLSLPLQPIVSIPGLPQLQASETPSFIHILGSYPGFSHLLVNQFSNFDQADWILYSSFYKLEEEVVDWMAKKWRIGTIGPTLPSMYLDKRLEDDKDYGIHLFQPDTSTCLNWLKTKPTNSVVYVSFGSMAQPDTQQMEELAWGLKATNYSFLWVVREIEHAKLPHNFKEENSEKCLMVKWCPQLEVLAHDSIGCFVTHCGLNSVLEALSLGVPIVGMPQWTDQPTNAKFVEDVWKIGIRALPDEKGVVRRQELEVCIRQVMEGEKGKEIKENAIKWKNLAIEAISEGGTSDTNIDEFIAKLSGS